MLRAAGYLSVLDAPREGAVTPVDGVLTERSGAMKSLPERIIGYAEAKPEASPIQSESLLHFGDRAAVRRAPSRQVEKSLDAVLPKLSAEDLSELLAARTVMPSWMVEPLGRRLAHG